MGETPTGKPKRPGCTCSVDGSTGGCYHHDTARAAQRSRAASRAAKGRGNPEVRAVKKLIDELTEKARTGELEPRVSNAVVALQNLKLRAIEVERRLEEFDVRGEFEALKRDLGIS